MTSKVSKLILASANSNVTTLPDLLPVPAFAAAVERQQVLHPAEELVQVERLGEILVGAHVEAAGAVFGQRAGGEDQHGRVHVEGPQGLADRVAAHARQHQVENHQVDVLAGSPA